MGKREKTVALVGTFDSKGEEFLFVKQVLEETGLSVLAVHAGVFDPVFEPDISNTEVALAAGADINELAAGRDRHIATKALEEGLKILIPRLYQEGKFDGILSMGGSGGTSLVTPAMQLLPFGVPKVMVSTMASGNVAGYVGTSDIVMIPSVVDVAGLNRISKTVFRNAAGAIAGMVRMQEESSAKAAQTQDKPVIAATMFGVTTPCVTHAKELLEKAGYEVLVFHANGTGGKTMESLIDRGLIDGVLDITTTEMCDEVIGGVLSAGPHRCEAAIRQQIPQVVSVGACDMGNFGHRSTVPEQYRNRNLYEHNAENTLMRLTEEESREAGRLLAEKWNAAESPMTVLLPERGVSMLDAKGGPFDGEKERQALFASIREHISNEKVKIIGPELHINDPAFAEMAVSELLSLM